MNVNALLSETFDLVLGHKLRFTQALVIPLILLIVLDVVGAVGVPVWMSPILTLLGLVIHSIFAITTHRLVLLGPDSVPRFGLNRVTKREVLFSVYVVIIWMVLLAPVWLTSQFLTGPEATFLILASVLMCFYLLARVSLVFPGVAVDRWVTIKFSWRLTHQHQKAMILIVVLFPLAILIPVTILSALLPGLMGAMFYSLAGTVLLVFTIAALSLAYREAVREDSGN